MFATKLKEKSMTTLKSKIRGMFTGVALGDALGMPLEGQTRETIFAQRGWVSSFVKPIREKWADMPKGKWTDDTQLTLATAQALIDADCFHMDTIANYHIEALNKASFGWGSGTKAAIVRLKEGKHDWVTSAERNPNGTGAGNGVSMKVAPVAGYFCGLKKTKIADLVNFTLMTHYTKLAIQSAIMQTYAILYCLKTDPNDFDGFKFIKTFKEKLDYLEKMLSSYMCGDPMPQIDHKYDMRIQVKKLTFFKMMDREEAHVVFGNGNFFVFNSLPFSHYFFLQNPNSFASVEHVVNAGGDTDTNGSQVGALVGALNGEGVFPEKLVAQVEDIEKILDVADEFYEKFVKVKS
tara:strand:- start:194 stop:1243 length:1050 start_codon:yes stop_codon:yes gene_type:complete